MNKILEPSTAKCELSVSSSEYQIRSMPVLSQFDPLLQYSPYWPLANGKPPPGQPPKFFVGNNADCYNTSIVSLIIAALANREQTRLPKPSGRTATFDQIPPSPPVSWNPPANETTPPATIPKEINQLAYYLKTLKETNNYLYYPGVLTDFGPVYQNPRLYNGSNNLVFTSNYGATFRDWLTRDTTHVTNEYVIDFADEE